MTTFCISLLVEFIVLRHYERTTKLKKYINNHRTAINNPSEALMHFYFAYIHLFYSVAIEFKCSAIEQLKYDRVVNNVKINHQQWIHGLNIWWSSMVNINIYNKKRTQIFWNKMETSRSIAHINSPLSQYEFQKDK